MKGRPLKTDIRARLGALLSVRGHDYGYNLYKIYKKVFGRIGMRNLYYNLKKGVELGEFVESDVKRESGDFTWGGETKHVYYSIGPNAIIYSLTERQREILKQFDKKEMVVDWNREAKRQIEFLRKRIEKYTSHRASMVYEDVKRGEMRLRREVGNLKDWIKERLDNPESKILMGYIEELKRSLDFENKKIGEFEVEETSDTHTP